MAQPKKQVNLFVDPKTGQWQATFLHTEHPVSLPDMKQIARTLKVAHKSYLLSLRLETRRKMAEDEAKRGTPKEVNDG